MTNYRHSPLADQAPGQVETITQWDGHTMGGRVPAFIGLAQKTGGVFYENTADNPKSVPELLHEVGLDFEVELAELRMHVPGMNADGEFEVREEVLPNHFASYGRMPNGTLVPFGPVGTRYNPIQNTTVAEIGQAVIDNHDGSACRAIGAFGDPIGSRVYFAFDLGQFTVGGHDRHDLTLTLLTSHDGNSGLSAMAAPIRFACTNMANGIFGRKTAGRWSIRHTESADGRVQEIRDALRLTWKYVERYQAESEQLLAEGMTEREFLAFQHELFDVPNLEDASARQRTIVANRDEELLGIWNGPTSEFGRRTRWAAAQSVYEYLDWYRRVRGADDADFARWERSLGGEDESVKAKTWDLLLTA